MLDGVHHREDGPAVEHPDGTRGWYRHGLLHREDGPAHEAPNGSRAWFINDQAHRLDGPAVILATGRHAWWVHGTLVPADQTAVLDELYAAGEESTLALVLTTWHASDGSASVGDIAAAVRASLTA